MPLPSSLIQFGAFYLTFQIDEQRNSIKKTLTAMALSFFFQAAKKKNVSDSEWNPLSLCSKKENHHEFSAAANINELAAKCQVR